MLRDNQGRARTARLVFLVYAAVSATIVLLSLLGLANPGQTTGDGLPTALLMGSYGLLLVLQLALNVAGYVVIILWLRRAYYNLHQVATLRPEFSDGWAAGAWFVPFINLWRPYGITREVWDGTQYAAFGRVVRPAQVLGWWWAAYLLKLVATQVADRLLDNDKGLQASDMLPLLIASNFACAYGILTWRIIGQSAGFEEQLALRQQVEQLGQAAPAIPAALLGEQLSYGQAEGY